MHLDFVTEGPCRVESQGKEAFGGHAESRGSCIRHLRRCSLCACCCRGARRRAGKQAPGRGKARAVKSDGPSGHAGCAVMTGADVPEFALKPTVYVVDDDACIREALDEMLTLAGMGVVTCASAGDYFRVPKPDLPSCLILDVGLPDTSGIDLQRQLSTEDHPPIIFLTGASDIPTSVRAIKAGAVDYLTKPCRKADLLAAIETAIVQDCHVRTERAERVQLRQRHS